MKQSFPFHLLPCFLLLAIYGLTACKQKSSESDNFSRLSNLGRTYYEKGERPIPRVVTLATRALEAAE